MKKSLLLLTYLLSAMAWSATDKIAHCPTADQVDILMVGEPNIYLYVAQNNDGKYFGSRIYGGNEHNGPAPAIGLIDARYNENLRELTCSYSAYSLYGYPVLTNRGDY